MKTGVCHHRVFIWLVALVICFGTMMRAADTWSLNAVKAGDLTIELRMENATLSVGYNHVHVIIRDSAGKTLKHAKVKMEYEVSNAVDEQTVKESLWAVFADDSYDATLDIPVHGPCSITVKFIPKGGGLHTASFRLNVERNPGLAGK